MENNRKKIFAREFLILVFCLLIALLTLLGAFLWNYYYRVEIQKLNIDLELIDEKISTLRTPTLEDQKNQKIRKSKIKNQEELFTKFYQSDVYSSYYSNYYTFWNRLESINKSDSLSYYWDDWDKGIVTFFKKNNFKNSEQLRRFIEKNSLTDSAESNSENNSEEIKTLLYEEKPFIRDVIKEKRAKILDCNKLISLILKIFFISFFVLFPIRYLTLLTIWSFKTVFSKTETK